VSTDGATCSAGNTSWQDGWIVFSDQNADGVVESPPDFILRSSAAFKGSDTFAASNAVSVVTFNREGFAQNIPAGTLVTLHAATPTTATTRCLSVTLIGIMAVQTAGGACT
jgi:type IV fimbrial biogenesis protein FimT